MIFEKVLSTIKKYNLIEDGDRIVLGISGGPDSVTLLHILNRLKEKMDIKIYAAHLNHQIRGLKAEEDAFYVAEICESMGIMCFLKSIDVPKYCKENGFSIEEGARYLRYEMFEEIKIKTKSNKIALGHNMNDQAETMLMRIIRGTGLKGLKGIDYIREDGVIRPLLDIDRKDIEAYCDNNNLNPRTDESNLETIYTRNKIRLDLIPYIDENFDCNIKEALVRMSSSLKFDNDFIEKEAERFFYEVSKISKDRVDIDIQLYKSLHNAIKLRILKMGINKILGDTKQIELKHINDIIELEAENKIDKKINLPRGIIVYRNKDFITITNKEIVIEEVEFLYNIPNEAFVKIKEIGLVVQTQKVSINKFKNMKKDSNSRGFDLDKIKGSLVITSRKQGDKIKLSNGTKKIKDLFIDLKIPKEERSKIPILKDDNGILLVGDYRVSEDYKIDLNTKEVLKVTFSKALE